MNAVALFILLAGIVFIVVGYCQNQHVCPPPKIEYRYIPRSFYDEQLSVPQVSNQYYDMFNNESPSMSFPTNIKLPVKGSSLSYQPWGNWQNQQNNAAQNSEQDS